MLDEIRILPSTGSGPEQKPQGTVETCYSTPCALASRIPHPVSRIPYAGSSRFSIAFAHLRQKGLNRARLLDKLHFMRVFSRLLVIIALCFAIGLHWSALQSIAWTTMVVEYAKDAPFAEALAKAFDGQHPCSLCHAVQIGKKSEQKNNPRTVTRIDLYCAASPNPRIHEFLLFDYPADTTSPIARTDSPLTPPPRLAA